MIPLTVTPGNDPRDGRDVIVVSGELDAASAGLLEQVGRTAIQTSRAADVSVDLAGVTFCDSVGVRALLALRRAAETDGKLLILQDCSLRVTRILQLTGVADFFPERRERADSEPRDAGRQTDVT